MTINNHIHHNCFPQSAVTKLLTYPWDSFHLHYSDSVIFCCIHLPPLIHLFSGVMLDSFRILISQPNSTSVCIVCIVTEKQILDGREEWSFSVSVLPLSAAAATLLEFSKMDYGCVRCIYRLFGYSVAVHWTALCRP